MAEPHIFNFIYIFLPCLDKFLDTLNTCRHIFIFVHLISPAVSFKECYKQNKLSLTKCEKRVFYFKKNIYKEMFS